MENLFDNKRTFDNLGIEPPILKALEDMGFESPTEVQSRAIPHILGKKDLIVMSKTGSGKTAVFGVSMLQLTDPQAAGPQGLILTPTRELAVQVDNDIRLMAKHLPHKTTAVYGQHSMNAEVQALSKGPVIVTGTPGRVFDHIEHGNLKTRNIRFLVLDEADRMLDMGFISQVEQIIRTIPKDRVTMLFSATIPVEIKRICTKYMKDPVTIEIESQTKTVDAIRQLYFRVEKNEKRTQLIRLLLAERPESCMIFCNTRIAVDQVKSFLNRQGYACHALHGEIPQAKRLKTIQQFKQGEFRILVATDVAARGIHIDELSLVINYDVPVEKDSYVHRIGRTGRAGREGRAVSLVTSDDIISLYEIEEHIGTMIEEAELPSDGYLNEHKAEIDAWKKANEAKVHEQVRANRKKGGSNERSREKGYRESGSNRSRTDNGQSRSKTDKGPDRSRADNTSTITNYASNKNRTDYASKKKRTDYVPGSNRSDNISGSKTDNVSNRRTDNASSQHSKYKGQRQDRAQKPYSADNRQSRTQRPYTSSDGKKPGSAGSIPKPAANDQVKKPAEKKGFFRRLIDKVLGR